VSIGRQVGPSLAMVKSDNVITAPCDTMVLFPNEGGNMHCFTAHAPCAVLDVLGPPYSDEESRHCTYYNDFPLSTFPGTTFLLPTILSNAGQHKLSNACQK
jgi:plant cysteine oxidase